MHSKKEERLLLFSLKEERFLPIASFSSIWNRATAARLIVSISSLSERVITPDDNCFITASK